MRHPDGKFPTVPSEAWAIVERKAKGLPAIIQYTPPECETSGESNTNWQRLAMDAVEKYLRVIEGGGALETLDALGIDRGRIPPPHTWG